METAIAYVRVSDPRQAKEGNSLATQEKQARDYAQKQGYHLDHLFIERGESAKTEDRHILKEMLEYCRKRQGSIQVLIVPKIDRFARNRDDYGALKLMLKRLGVRLDSVGETIEDTPVGRFTESLLASVAQFDNEIRAERSKNGMVDSVRAGRWVWKAPAGFKNVRVRGKGTIAPDAVTGPIVTKAFELIVGGTSAKSVSSWLTKNGIPMTKNGVREMVSNSLYIGLIRAFGLEVPAAPPFVALVTPAQFYHAQEALQRKSIAKRAYVCDNPDFVLRGSVLCECGRPLIGSWAHGRAERYAYYRCMTCSCVNLRRHDVELAFRLELDSYQIPPADMARLVDYLCSKSREQNKAFKAGIDRADGEISRIKQLQASLALKNAEGVIPDEVAKEQLSELSKQLSFEQERKDQVLMSERAIEELVVFGLNFLGGMGAWWGGAVMEEKKNLQSWLYPKGVVYQRNGNFRTADYPQLEQIKTMVRGGESTVVYQSSDSYELLLDFLVSLKRQFG